MKCPKCGYHSFEHLENCKKCGVDLADHKQKFNLRGFFSLGQVDVPAAAETGDVAEEETVADDGNVDFGFDFLDEESGSSPEPKAAVVKDTDSDDLADAFAETDDVPRGGREDEISFEDDDVNIDQPFGIDSETVPVDATKPGTDDKKGPGSEFSF